MAGTAIVQVETMSIPTYPISDCEKMPMFNENRMHQGTKGNPYPVMPILSVARENCQPKDYEVVRMENDFIRLIIIPSLGGRIFEAYDKVHHYDFLYRQHVIKPALIGAYGLWISGGLEFNWPFHHRPSTFMPVNFTTEVENDGTCITWLSECDCTDRIIQTIGIVLHPDAAFFETRILTTNRTPIRHSFLSWENAAVPVNDDYQFVFPPDVNYVNNHYSMGKPPMTYPIAQGRYASATYEEPIDISWYKNCHDATSHFAAPSKYDFFGGYDHGKKCGIIHIADHYLSPGKKMFTWGRRTLASNWERALTDADGSYCELMAGSYSDNQPDFTWLNPYETKRFSEFWYPIGEMGKPNFATLNATVTVNIEEGFVVVQTTRAQRARVILRIKEHTLLDITCNLEACSPVRLDCVAGSGLYTISVIADDGTILLEYKQEKLDEVHYPEPIVLNPHPDTIQNVQELWLQGTHVDQYRHHTIEPDVYYREALRRDPHHIPSLVALGEYSYRRGFFSEAEELLKKAIQCQHVYNTRYQDEEASYLLGLTLDAQGRSDEAYDSFFTAAWCGSMAARAMTKIAAIDARRGNYQKALAHAQTALEYGAGNPIANAYLALAAWKLGKTDEAVTVVEKALNYDKMNDLLGYIKYIIGKQSIEQFWAVRRSDASQIALDTAFDLMDAGYDREAANILNAVADVKTPMVYYTRAFLHADADSRQQLLSKARNCKPQNFFPYRLAEIKVLRWAVEQGDDPTALDLLACVLYDKRHYEEAITLWRKAHALAPGVALYCRNLAVALFSHGVDRMEAFPLLERAIALDPKNLQLQTEYLYAATKAGLPGEKRLEMINKYHVSGVKSDDFVLEYAKAYCIAGKYDEAMKTMLSHTFMPAEGGEMAINGVYFNILLHDGCCALKDQEWEKALAIFEQAEVLPKNLNSGLWADAVMAPFYYYKAIALEKLGRHKESLVHYNLTLKRFSPAYVQYSFYYVMALRALNRGVEARIFLSKMVHVLEEKISHPSIGFEDYTAAFNSFINRPQEQRRGMYNFWRGMIKLAEGDEESAKAMLEESRRLWPENLETWVRLDIMNH